MPTTPTTILESQAKARIHREQEHSSASNRRTTSSVITLLMLTKLGLLDMLMVVTIFVRKVSNNMANLFSNLLVALSVVR